MLLTLKEPSVRGITELHFTSTGSGWSDAVIFRRLWMQESIEPSAERRRHMIREILLGSIFFIALTAPTMAQDQCVAPIAPVIPDGARATSAQIIAEQNEIKAFATASDNYQTCLAAEIGRQKDLAKQT